MDDARLSVLVVDDEPALREVLSLRIADWGHDVRAVADAAEGGARDRSRSAGSRAVRSRAARQLGNGAAQAHQAAGRTPSRRDDDGARQHRRRGRRDESRRDGFSHQAARLQRALRAARRSTARISARQRVRSSLERSARPAAGRRSGSSDRAGRCARCSGRSSRSPSSDASAILTGESGTGKEVVARAIHAASARRDKPFIAINAAAIPEGLVESEVFGHEQGAFTGATRSRPGVFELANGGTLFLDEIAEMPISLQPKLLRVLEDSHGAPARRQQGHEVRRARARRDESSAGAGDSRRTPARRSVLSPERVRAHAATAARAARRHRAARAALRARVRSQAPASRSKASATRRAKLLEAHAWPGNVRELRNVIERATIVARSGWIEPRHLPPYLQALRHGASPTLTLPAGHDARRGGAVAHSANARARREQQGRGGATARPRREDDPQQAASYGRDE